jgi:hypothetical protein
MVLQSPRFLPVHERPYYFLAPRCLATLTWCIRLVFAYLQQQEGRLQLRGHDSLRPQDARSALRRVGLRAQLLDQLRQRLAAGTTTPIQSGPSSQAP